ncbi:MAG: oxidoreductase [Ferruginibacter sp.]|nr:oxidoreductase [Ferruginibacter sp.]
MLYQLKIIVFTIILSACFQCLAGQTIQLLSSGGKTSIRGLSVVDDRIVWVSGSNGTIGRSIDSGNTFKWMVVKGFEQTDFRDIEAFDETSAVIMGIAAPAYILRTADGGESWKVVYENKTSGMFLDAMEFWNLHSGIVIGDPIDGKFFIARTFDGGMSWRNIPPKNYPAADSGEACFASSGTNIRKLNQQEAVFVSGGLSANIFIRDKKILLPIIQGKETTGANSVAIKSSRIMVVVGGDFASKDSNIKNCYITKDAGKNWIAPLTPPHGYRSCVEWLGKKKWISCGLNGVDFSKDDGNNWNWISKESFHVCRMAKKGKAVFLAGGGGRIGKLSFN